MSSYYLEVIEVIFDIFIVEVIGLDKYDEC